MAHFTMDTRRTRRILFFRCLFVFAAFLAAFSTASVSIAIGPDSKHESDSAILARHEHEVRVEYTLEEFSDHSFNAGYSEDELDSIMALDRTRIESSAMYYSPDSAFKIAVIEMEGCGAYCNPFWESWLHFNDGSDLVIAHLNFARIQKIEKMPDGKYLVIDQMSGRSGMQVDITTRATLISLQDYQFKTYTIPKIPSEEMKYDSALFVIQSAFIDTSQYIHYDAKTERLNYQYAVYTADLSGDFSDSDSITMYNGYLQYEKGAFIFKEEKSIEVYDTEN